MEKYITVKEDEFKLLESQVEAYKELLNKSGKFTFLGQATKTWHNGYPWFKLEFYSNAEDVINEMKLYKQQYEIYERRVDELEEELKEAKTRKPKGWFEKLGL